MLAHKLTHAGQLLLPTCLLGGAPRVAVGSAGPAVIATPDARLRLIPLVIVAGLRTLRNPRGQRFGRHLANTCAEPVAHVSESRWLTRHRVGVRFRGRRSPGLFGGHAYRADHRPSVGGASAGGALVCTARLVPANEDVVRRAAKLGRRFRASLPASTLPTLRWPRPPSS